MKCFQNHFILIIENLLPLNILLVTRLDITQKESIYHHV